MGQYELAISNELLTIRAVLLLPSVNGCMYDNRTSANNAFSKTQDLALISLKFVVERTIVSAGDADTTGTDIPVYIQIIGQNTMNVFDMAYG